MTDLSGKDIIVFLDVLNMYSDELKDRIQEAVIRGNYMVYIGDIVEYTINRVAMNRRDVHTVSSILKNVAGICLRTCDKDDIAEFTDDMEYMFF